MVGITIRLPRETLQRVRRLASAERLKPTALIRRWTEEAVAAEGRLAPAAEIRPFEVTGVDILINQSAPGVVIGEHFRKAKDDARGQLVATYGLTFTDQGPWDRVDA